MKEGTERMVLFLSSLPLPPVKPVIFPLKVIPEEEYAEDEVRGSFIILSPDP